MELKNQYMILFQILLQYQTIWIKISYFIFRNLYMIYVYQILVIFHIIYQFYLKPFLILIQSKKIMQIK